MLTRFKLNFISLFYLTISVSLFIYTFYRSEIVYDGLKFIFYLKYYLISLALIIFSFFSFFLRRNIQLNLFTVILSIYFVLIFIEILLANHIFNEINLKKYEIKTSKKFDRRNRYQVFIDEKKINPDIKITLPPSSLYDFNKKIYPLGGISYSKTINCNENGNYSFFKSDRFGFNNPDHEWDKSEKLITVIGDSYAMGSCVDRPYDISSQLRKKIDKKFAVINIAYGGNDLLLEYASLREYFKLINSRFIVRLIYEDDADNNSKHSTTLLQKYLNEENFSQSLINRQNIVDNHLNEIITTKLNNYEINKNFLKYIFNTLKLYYLRISLRVSKLEYGKFGSSSKDIIQKVKKFSNQNNSNLIVVYLPSVRTIKINEFNNINKKSLLEILEDESINFIDIGIKFKNDVNVKDYLTIKYPGHFNKLGYKKVSEIIFDYIQKNNQ